MLPASLFSHIRLLVTPWTAAHQAPLSMGFSRQEYWSGLPRPPPGDLPDPGITPTSFTSPAGRQVLHHEHHLGSPNTKKIHVPPIFPAALFTIARMLKLNKAPTKGCVKRWGTYTPQSMPQAKVRNGLR